mmetsp:Transcript_4129/g.8529  ORF Transcript_4129/g.8529 Transcript_4129/m.8529 type:complete len:287 (+) Transcript_4129:53-913(+)|eukprot:CAMPEP_0168753232 /NCGR_PEP_ID=MMETSP0724-20121128/18821_1 /TAXON_ID=265536 /ORGANISM="Amphiprora sp., Strain CCMP467" /LENGTH=286 /DNA_ID=CAMNT_0008801557 /DNA_START=200 /DNA_END=1060 /DNA_ORIENTATION=-
MVNSSRSSSEQSSSAWGLQLLIGPAAASTTASNHHYRNNQPSTLAPSATPSAFTALLLGLYVGGCVSIPGGWHALFDHVEGYVINIYSGLVVLYLTTLLVAGPLESLYQYCYPPKQQQEPPQQQQRQSQQQEQVPTPTEPQPFDLSGAYKLMSNDGFENFLAVQGVPWALRRAANQARPTHRITHIGNQLTIKIEGIIESQTTYTIGGPPVETNVRGRIFEDQVRYLEGDTIRGICVSKTALTEDYDVTVQRVLSEDGQSIVMTSRAVFRDDREPVECIQQFQRIE